MSLLTSHLTCHPGNVAALVELLLVANRPLTESNIEELLHPPGVAGILGKEPSDASIKHAIEVAEWCKAVKCKDGDIVLTPALKDLKAVDLLTELPVVISGGLFDRTWTGEIKEDRLNGGDLALVMAWFLMQDPFGGELTTGALTLAFGNQFNIKAELVNPEKLRQLRRWAKWFGLGRYDVVDNGLFIPDPTIAVGRYVEGLTEGNYSGAGFIKELSKLCPVLDNGKIRKSLLPFLRDGALPWETGPQKVSPALSLALWRLNQNEKIHYGLKDDAKQSHRCELVLPGEETVLISYVRIQK